MLFAKKRLYLSGTRSESARPASLLHVASTPAASISLRRVVEVWHASRIVRAGRRVGAVKPPIISRIAVISDAAGRVTVKEYGLDRFTEPAIDTLRDETCGVRGAREKQND